MTAIPRAQAPLVDAAGQPAREWYTYFLDLADSQGMTPAQQAAFLALAKQVAELEAASGDFIIQGIGSVRIFGLPSTGMVQISLDGDTDSPGATWFYGTGPDGARGWYALGDAIEVSAGELTKDVDPATGVITLGLPDVPDSGTGTLQRTAFDAKGRKTGTAAATTDDLSEGSTNLYFPEAPNDGKQYARQSLDWSEVSSFGYDDLKASLVAGANITITPDDMAETLTITGTGGGGGGGVSTVTGGTGITVNNTDPDNPVVALSSASQASLALADSALQSSAIGISVQGYSATLDDWALIDPADKADAGAIGSSGLTMATDRILGRTTAGTGVPEEITVGSGLSLSSGVLSATGGGGSGTVTSVDVAGGTGISASGGPITGSGTITLSLSANLQAWSGVAPSDYIAVGSTGKYLTDISLDSSLDTLIYQAPSSKHINFRSGSVGAYKGFVMSSSGDFQVTNGGISVDTHLFSSGTQNIVSVNNGAILLRPVGPVSTTGQASVENTGDVRASRYLISGADGGEARLQRSGDTTWFGINASNIGMYDSVTGWLLRGERSTGSIYLARQNSEFYRAAANSTTTTRQPRIFVGGGDPGAAAANGDIWIP